MHETMEDRQKEGAYQKKRVLESRHLDIVE